MKFLKQLTVNIITEHLSIYLLKPLPIEQYIKEYSNYTAEMVLKTIEQYQLDGNYPLAKKTCADFTRFMLTATPTMRKDFFKGFTNLKDTFWNPLVKHAVILKTKPLFRLLMLNDDFTAHQQWSWTKKVLKQHGYDSHTKDELLKKNKLKLSNSQRVF